MPVQNRVGPPVRGTDFFGRETFVDLVWEKLSGGHILLAAPRRFGKTSVLYRLIDEPRQGFKVIHADLEKFRHPSELMTELIVQLAKQDRLSKIVSRLTYFPSKLWKEFRNTVEEIDLYEFRLKLKQQLEEGWEEKADDLFSRIAACDETLIFILDELPMMIDFMRRTPEGRDEARSLLLWLRALRTSPDRTNVRFIVAGSIGIGQILAELGEVASINDLEQLRLEPFPRKTAAALIDNLSRTEKVELSPACRSKMLNLIGTYVPYFIQVLFSEVAKSYKQYGESVTPKKIEKIYHDKVLGVDCKIYFQHYYGRIHDYYPPHEERAIKVLLLELATNVSVKQDVCYQLYRRSVGKPAQPDGFSYLMSNLENDFYIRFDSGTTSYEFSCKILRDWWLRHHGLETS
jgi:hypothetical protein